MFLLLKQSYSGVQVRSLGAELFQVRLESMYRRISCTVYHAPGDEIRGPSNQVQGISEKRKASPRRQRVNGSNKSRAGAQVNPTM